MWYLYLWTEWVEKQRVQRYDRGVYPNRMYDVVVSYCTLVCPPLGDREQPSTKGQ